MRGEARPQLLDTSRIQLELQRVKPTHSKIGEELEKLLGTVEIKVKRWFDLWKYLKWLLPQWDRLGFNMQSQQQTNWCWAATSTSTAVYYNATTTWTQCTVANGETGRTDCCGTGGSGACNVYGFLDTALTRVGHFDHRDNSAGTFASMKTEINAGRPVGIRVAWSGGGADFLAIIGYLDDATNYVAVDDPIYGKSDITFATLTSTYQSTGSWTHTYYTKA